MSRTKEQTPWSRWEFDRYVGRRLQSMRFVRRRVWEIWFGILRTETQTRILPEEIGRNGALALLNGDIFVCGRAADDLRTRADAAYVQGQQLAEAVRLAEEAAAAITTLRQGNAALVGHNRNLMKALEEEKDAYKELLAAVNATKPSKAKRRVRRAR